MMLMDAPSREIQIARAQPATGRLLATPDRGSFFHLPDRSRGGTRFTDTSETSKKITVTTVTVSIVALGIVRPATFVSSAACATASIPRYETMANVIPCTN